MAKRRRVVRRAHAEVGVSREAVRAGRIVVVSEFNRVYRVARRDVFDALDLPCELAVIGRRWQELYAAGRLMPDAVAIDMGSRGGAEEISDAKARAHAKVKQVLRALRPAARWAAVELANDRCPKLIDVSAVLRSVSVEMDKPLASEVVDGY